MGICTFLDDYGAAPRDCTSFEVWMSQLIGVLANLDHFRCGSGAGEPTDEQLDALWDPCPVPSSANVIWIDTSIVGEPVGSLWANCGSATDNGDREWLQISTSAPETMVWQKVFTGGTGWSERAYWGQIDPEYEVDFEAREGYCYIVSYHVEINSDADPTWFVGNTPIWTRLVIDGTPAAGISDVQHHGASTVHPSAWMQPVGSARSFPTLHAWQNIECDLVAGSHTAWVEWTNRLNPTPEYRRAHAVPDSSVASIVIIETKLTAESVLTKYEGLDRWEGARE